MKILSNILLCIFVGGIVLIFGGFCSVVAALASGKTFYGYAIMAADISLILYLVISTFGSIKKRILNRFLGVVTAACVVASIGYAIREKVYESVATVNEKAVDMDSYKPFAKDTKVVSLSEESTLKITSQVPRLDGATALYPLYSSFARAVYPEKNYERYDSEVMCTTTEGAYKNLIEGYADIIFVSRPSSEQVEDAKRRGVKLELAPIGREAFVFFVNSKNKVGGLSTKQIQDIYSEQITNWKEVGGANESIKAFQRPENSGSQTMLQKFMEGKNLMAPPKGDVVFGMDGIIRNTADYKNYKNAIGYSFLFYATEMVKNNQIHLLKVDGVYPSRETIKSKEYPLSAEFYAVTAGSSNPNVNAFIKWISGKQGQYLVDKTGYTPLGDVK